MTAVIETTELDTFESFGKIARLNRTITVTEKIDGTNAQVCVTPDGRVLAGSRNRWVTPEDDNYGFAAWVRDHEDELRGLGVGRHFGEWWGRGIQRGYGLAEKRFSLFNVSRWGDDSGRPACCGVVPLVAESTFAAGTFIFWRPILEAITLLETGSVAAPGFDRPEGIVVWHSAARQLFKWTFDGDGAKGTQ